MPGALRLLSRRGVSWLAAVALTSVGATAGLALSVMAPRAGADPIGDCSTTTGVIVAVDFTQWGGSIERGCDATLTTGYAAIHRAGFTTAGDAHDGPGFICRIDDKPSPSEESCVTTPPADESWSYWHADVGQDTWTYSTLGALDYQPPPGSVDAWTFASTDIGPDGQPTFPPSAVRATNSSGPGPTSTTTTAGVPTTTVAPSTAPPPRPSPSTAGAGGGPPAAVRHSSSTTDPDGTGGHGGVTSTTGSAPTTAAHSAGAAPGPAGGAPSTPRIVDAAPATDRPSVGSPVPALVGVGVALALAGAGGVVAWRRRRIN